MTETLTAPPLPPGDVVTEDRDRPGFEDCRGTWHDLSDLGGRRC